MKGLAITILLAVAELVAVNSSNDKLFADDTPNLPAIRREEAGIQSEVLVDAERLEIETPAPAMHADAG